MMAAKYNKALRTYLTLSSDQAHLLTGVHEQSYLAHLVSYAACLQEDSLGCPASGAARMSVEALAGLAVIHLVWLL